jgi:hypothetical protein
MRNLSSLCFALALPLSLTACGDDETGTGGSAGGTTSSSTTGATTSGSTTSSSTTSSTTSSTSTGMAGCAAVAGMFDQTLSDVSWSATVSPNIGGPDPDYVILVIPEGTSGTVELTALPASLSACGDTESCVLVFEDFVDPTPPARIYAANAGTVMVDAPVVSGFASGVLNSIDLVEVTYDNDTSPITAVPDGACASITAMAFAF